MGSERAVYSQDIDTVYAKLLDPDFLRARAEASGETDIEISITEQGGDTVLQFDRDLETDLPSFAKRLFNPKNHLVERQVWRDQGDGKAGEFSVDIQGTPAKVNGTFTLRPVDGGTEHVINFTIEAKVPLIRKKLEKFIDGETAEGIRADYEYNKQNF